MQLYRSLSNFELLWEMSSSETQKTQSILLYLKGNLIYTLVNSKEVITCWYVLLQSTIVRIYKQH